MKVYTMQLSQWRFAAEKKMKIKNITVKGAIDLLEQVLKPPSMKLVMDHKKGYIDDDMYLYFYEKHVRDEINKNREALIDYIDAIKEDTIVLSCFCGSEKFCHRHTAIKILKEFCEEIGISCSNEGEHNARSNAIDKLFAVREKK